MQAFQTEAAFSKWIGNKVSAVWEHASQAPLRHFRKDQAGNETAELGAAWGHWARIVK